VELSALAALWTPPRSSCRGPCASPREDAEAIARLVNAVTVAESLEDSASGKLVEGILASIAEFYSANLGQEIRKGMDQKAAQGGWPVRTPFGYRNIRRGGPGRRGESVLEPDPQAPLIVWALEWYATGSLSLDVLTEALAEKGLRNRLGNPPGKSAVHRMLRNPVLRVPRRFTQGLDGGPSWTMCEPPTAP
jgi:hypothetical protein